MDAINEGFQEALQRFTFTKLISAVITLIICMLINKVLIKITAKILERTKLNAKVKKIIERAVKILLYTLATLVILAELGFNTSSLIALVSVFSLGITLAMEDLLGNAAGGLVLASVRCFTEGDFIKVNDLEGKVIDTRLSHTIVMTYDGYMATVPNKGLATNTVINYTNLGRVRLGLEVAGSYNDDPRKVVACLRNMLDEYETILRDPEPMVFVDSYGDSSINYKVYCWTAFADRYKTKINMNMRVWEVFKENGLHMDFNHLNVHMMKDEPEDGPKNDPDGSWKIDGKDGLRISQKGARLEDLKENLKENRKEEPIEDHSAVL